MFFLLLASTSKFPSQLLLHSCHNSTQNDSHKYFYLLKISSLFKKLYRRKKCDFWGCGRVQTIGRFLAKNSSRKSIFFAQNSSNRLNAPLQTNKLNKTTYDFYSNRSLFLLNLSFILHSIKKPMVNFNGQPRHRDTFYHHFSMAMFSHKFHSECWRNVLVRWAFLDGVCY